MRTFAHTAIGRDLHELLVGTNVGWQGGESFLSNAFFQSRINYSFVERVLGRSHNRTNIDTEMGYFLTPRLALSGLVTYQRHHGDALDHDSTRGLDQWTDEEFHHHDQLMRTNMLDVGLGTAFLLNGKTSVYANALHTVWGINGHPIQAGLIVGINWRFRTRRPRSLVAADDFQESLPSIQERH
jgi:hypothetical protein